MSKHPLRFQNFQNRAISIFSIGILAFFQSCPVRSAAPLVNHAQEIRDDSTPADVFEAMKKSFRPTAAKGVHAHYQFDISGPAGGTWWIIVNDGGFAMGKGATENPDVTLTSSDKDWVMLSTGSLGGFRAYLTGRLKVTGDQSLAKKLDEIFP